MSLQCQRGGGTAFQHAAGGFVGLAHLLIKHGADIQAPGASVDGRTSIEAAAEHGSFDMVTYLPRRGPWPAFQLENAVRCATHNGHNAVATLVETALSLVGLQNMLSWAAPPLEMAKQCSAGQSSRIEEILPDHEISEDLLPHEKASQSLDSNIGNGSNASVWPVIEPVAIVESFLDHEDGDYSLREPETTPNTWLVDLPTDPTPLINDQPRPEHADVSIPLPTVQHRHLCNSCRRPPSNSSALKRHLRTKHKTRNDTMQFSYDFCNTRPPGRIP
ncbi:hypothetical protein TI39_contig497g00005 [Zymoseptoria brevis]|uniref:C2H2-type domain-containing protein n=1 Tax=Zymoseptoria brevis TaxID=1047168 RepID=A0A0F4GJF1_9PEZI|nr:hypothetical protein TI39_contig497g00005 [Zymoseptoria brevis]